LFGCGVHPPASGLNYRARAIIEQSFLACRRAGVTEPFRDVGLEKAHVHLFSPFALLFVSA
jgi:hypothetical protein